MNDLNGTAIAALAAALAPHIATELAKLNGTGGVMVQQGGGLGAQQNTGAQFAAQFAAQNPPPQQTSMLGGTAPVQQATPAVTPDMIQQLITPLVQNEQVKLALTAQMQQMGITNLPEARPEQLAELYQRFQNVEQQARAAGLLGAPGGGAPSII